MTDAQMIRMAHAADVASISLLVGAALMAAIVVTYWLTKRK